MTRCLSHFVFAVAIVGLCPPALSHAKIRTTEPITVRGVLSRGGKAGDLWTLTLDGPYQAHDAAQSNTDRNTVLRQLSFVGHRQGPQDPSLDGKHLELTGRLIVPFGPGRAGVVVSAINILSGELISTQHVIENQLGQLRRQLPPSSQYARSSEPWKPLPLKHVETTDGLEISGFTGQSSKTISPAPGAQSENVIPLSEAAEVISEWIVVPQNYWRNNFSHTGFPEYTRSLNLQSEGKTFVLELQPYGVGMLVFLDGGTIYIVSPCNAAGARPSDTTKTIAESPCR
jgi:hypothetical protein